MSNKSSKITEEHRVEAQKLKSLWNDGRPHRTQAEFGEASGLGSQANVGHYLNARSPLNTKAASAFAKELGCNVSDFSPRVALQLADLYWQDSAGNEFVIELKNGHGSTHAGTNSILELERAVNLIADKLNQIDSEKERGKVADRFVTLASAPDSKKLRHSIVLALNGGGDEDEHAATPANSKRA